MARRKTITRDQILNAAYEVVATEGFSRFTARNIAAKMKCSTQPIYLEFKNMDELRQALFEKIKHHLLSDVFSQKHIGDPIIDLILNYIDFASTETKLYRSLFVEEHNREDILNEFTYSLFMEKLEQDTKLKTLGDDKKKALFSATWIVATGFASLKAGGHINPTEDQVVSMVHSIMNGILSENNNTILW